MEIRDSKVFQDYLNGVICGENVVTSKKIFRDAKNFYLNNECGLNDEIIMYEVYSYTQGNPDTVGNLNWGLTVLNPIYVNNECNMTRGHFHENLDCAEIYFCLGGEGLLLYMDEKGKCFAEKMSVGSIHHINGEYAHRLINTSDVALKVGACWPTIAGHDYKRIEDKNFTVRVFKENGNVIVKERK